MQQNCDPGTSINCRKGFRETGEGFPNRGLGGEAPRNKGMLGDGGAKRPAIQSRERAGRSAHSQNDTSHYLRPPSRARIMSTFKYASMFYALRFAFYTPGGPRDP